MDTSYLTFFFFFLIVEEIFCYIFKCVQFCVCVCVCVCVLMNAISELSTVVDYSLIPLVISLRFLWRGLLVYSINDDYSSMGLFSHGHYRL